MVPLRRFSPTLRSLRLESLVKFDGSDPPRELVSILSIVKAVNEVREGGIVPVRDFPVKSILVMAPVEQVTPVKTHLLKTVDELQVHEVTVAIFVDAIISHIKPVSTSSRSK